MAKRANRVGRPRKDAGALAENDVLDAALKLLDAGGERAVTFRALADELGVTPMAVSYHVGSRRQMFASLVARVYAGVGTEPDVAEPTERLRLMLRHYCERVIAHPALAQCVFADPSLFSGQLVALTDSIAATLAALGAEPAELETLVGVVVDFTHGFAFAAAASPEDGRARPSIDDYARGLGWILDRIAGRQCLTSRTGPRRGSPPDRSRRA